MPKDEQVKKYPVRVRITLDRFTARSTGLANEDLYTSASGQMHVIVTGRLERLINWKVDDLTKSIHCFSSGSQSIEIDLHEPPDTLEVAGAAILAELIPVILATKTRDEITAHRGIRPGVSKFMTYLETASLSIGLDELENHLIESIIALCKHLNSTAESELALERIKLSPGMEKTLTHNPPISPRPPHPKPQNKL